MTKNTLLLKVSGLHAAFLDRPGTFAVLDDLNFEVPAGQFLCILGPSGSGKSTLLRILAGLLQPTAGELHLAGQALRGPQDGVGVVFQNAGLMPWRTVQENIALPLEVKRENNGRVAQRTQEMIDLVGLDGFQSTLPRDLSGGMAQRVAIARALSHQPDLLLLDEPFGSLDAITRERMGTELLRIWNVEHKTIIMVTHDISEAVFLADRVLVLSDRPAHIKLDLQINLSRPRAQELRYSQDFGKLAAELRAAIE